MMGPTGSADTGHDSQTSQGSAPSPASLNLALVGNCSISALIDAQARVVWCCLPRFDSDPVFHALVDSPDGIGAEGCWQIDLADRVSSEQHYVPGTAVLRTRLTDAQGGAIEITDFAPRFFEYQRPFRPLMLVRRVRPVAGRPRIRILLRPRAEWGAQARTRTRGSNHVRFDGAELSVRLTTNAPLTDLLEERLFALDGPISMLFGADEPLTSGIEATASLFEERTLHYWRVWTRRLALPLEWQDAVIRAAVTLKMCLYEDTGAIVAAMTTSIPEAPDSGRNWDYRFCWMRDAFFVVRALNSLSEVGTMEDYLRWLHNVVADAGDGGIQPLYGIGRERRLDESKRDHLRGYRGMGPVRVGNQAWEHAQHDVYGNIVLGAAQSFHDHRLFRRGNVDDFVQLERIGEWAWTLHDKPDAGMWELRSRARVHTSSVLMSWAACDRLAKIAAALALPERELLWRGRAETIRALVLKDAWNDKRQAFVESLGGSELDASVLLMAEVGFIDPRDTRFVSTVAAVESHLAVGAHVRRYEAADDYGVPHTAFNICTFWRIDALARIGRTAQAREIFETMLAARNPLGLLSEDTDPRTGEMWGNFPQTYSMVGIINAAMRLSAPWDTVI